MTRSCMRCGSSDNEPSAYSRVCQPCADDIDREEQRRKEYERRLDEAAESGAYPTA